MANATTKLLGGLEEAKEIAQAAFIRLRKNQDSGLEEKVEALSGGGRWRGLRIRKVEKVKRNHIHINGNGMMHSTLNTLDDQFELRDVDDDDDDDDDDEDDGDEDDEDEDDDESDHHHRRSRSRTASGGSSAPQKLKNKARRYHLRWETELGPIRGVLEMNVTIPAAPTAAAAAAAVQYGTTSSEEDDWTMVQQPVSMEEMRSKLRMMEGELRKKEAEMKMLKDAVVGAVVGHHMDQKENKDPNGDGDGVWGAWAWEWEVLNAVNVVMNL